MPNKYFGEPDFILHIVLNTELSWSVLLLGINYNITT